MSLFKQFGTNKEAEQEGVWVEYGPNDDGTVPAFKIARSGNRNKKWLKAVERLTRPHRGSALKDPELSRKIMVEVFSESVLVDWRNVQNKDGKPLAFSKAEAMALLEALPDLYDDLSSKADEATLFRDEALENEAKN